MDRAMVYTGALPQTIDILDTNKFAMMAIGYGMQMVLGTNTYVDGCSTLPTSPTPDLNIHVQVGSIYSLIQVDASAYSDLGTDATFVVKQGIQAAIQNFAITPPATGGFSQVFLVEVEYQDLDTGSSVLSYYNSSNPAAPFSGPANAGTSNFTIRQGKCLVQIKAGVAAATGSQVTPAPDAGFTGLYAVTVANGQTQITSGNIVQLTTAPIVLPNNKLPAVPSSVQNGSWVYATDTSTGGAAVATNNTTGTGSAILNFASVPAYVTNGMKVFDLTTVGAITGGQTVLTKTSNTVTMTANANATVGNGDLIAFSNNAMVAAIAPVPTALVAGMEISVQASGTNSGATTLNLNGLGAVAIHRSNGAALSPGDIVANSVVGLAYDGSAWQIENFNGGAGGGTNTTTLSLPYGSDSSGSSNTITVAPSPAIVSLAAGQGMIVKLANPILGAVTINVSGQSASTLVSYTGAALAYGAAAAGEILWMVYDGTRWQLLNAPLPLQANTTIFVNPSTGSDTLDGSQATVSGTKGPLQHIQTAVNKAFQYGPSPFTVTIQLADGTYTNDTATTPTYPGPAIIINGDVSTPANVVVTNNTSNCFTVQAANQMTVQNLKVISTGTNAAAFEATNGANMTTNNTVSGTITTYCFLAGPGGTMQVGSHTFSGNVSLPFNASSGSLSLLSAANFTISASITATYFAQATSNGTITVPITGGVPTFTNPGNVTGTKFNANLNGVINTQGRGVNYFPGSVAGVLSPNGGQYA